MNKKILAYAVLIVVFISGGAGCISRTNDIEIEQRMTDSAQLRIISDHKTEEDKNMKYTISIDIPRAEGLPYKNSRVQDSLDEEVQKVITSIIEDFKNKVSSWNKENGSLIKNESSMSGLDVDFYIQSFSWRHISIFFKVNTYMAGAAHPNDTFVVFNYDIAEKQKIEIEDFFVKNSSYEERLSSLVKEKLVQKDIIIEKDKQIKEYFKKFVFSDIALSILFDDGELAPHARGPQVVTIMWNELKGITSNELEKLDLKK